jgi:hypothetical protein
LGRYFYIGCDKDLGIDIVTEVSKDLDKEVSKDLGLEVSKDLVTEVSIDLDKEVSKDLGLEVSKDLVTEVSKDLDKEVSIDLGIDLGLEVSKDLGKDVLKIIYQYSTIAVINTQYQRERGLIEHGINFPLTINIPIITLYLTYGISISSVSLLCRSAERLPLKNNL